MVAPAFDPPLTFSLPVVHLFSFELEKSLWFDDLRNPKQAVRSSIFEACKTSDTLNNVDQPDKTLCSKAACTL